MKTTIKILCGLMIMTMISCKKENKIAPVSTGSSKKYSVSFKVAGFTSDVTPFGVKAHSLHTAALDDQVKYITYAVFDDTGNIIKQIDQTAAGSLNFGTIKDDLPAGHYTIYIAAGNLSVFSFLNIDNTLLLLQDEQLKDTFLKKIDLTVSGPVEQNVELKRIVAKVTITLTDKFPAGANYMLFSASASSAYDLGTLKAWDSSSSQFLFATLTAADQAKPGYTITMYLYENDNTTFHITLRNTTNFSTVLDRDLTTVNIKPNMIYNLSGPMVSSNKSSFEVKVDDTWGGSETTNLNVASRDQQQVIIK